MKFIMVEVLNIMKPVKFVVLALLLAGLLSAFGPGVVWAQNTSTSDEDVEVLGEMSAEKVGKNAADLLTRIVEAVERIETYREKMTAATAEDSIVLRNQIYVLQLHAIEDIHALADALVKLEAEVPQPELRSGVEEAYVRVTPKLWEHIAMLRAEVDIFRARRLSTPGEERTALEDQVTKISGRLNAFYDLGRVHLQKMQELDMDAVQDSTVFVESVRERADELSGRLALDMSCRAGWRSMRSAWVTWKSGRKTRRTTRASPPSALPLKRAWTTTRPAWWWRAT